MNHHLNVGIIGEFDPARLSHRATNDALQHAARRQSVDLAIDWLPTTPLADDFDKCALRRFDALWCAPGGPYRSIQGALQSIRFAREQNWPFIGT